MVARLRAARPGLALTVTSADPASTAARHAVDAVDWRDIDALAAAAEGSNALILGGGGLFHDYWGCDPDALLQRHHAGIPQYLAVPLLASLVEKPLMIYAVGVGPLWSDAARELTRAAFDEAVVATVRDPASRARLAEIGVDSARVHVTADPAFDVEPQAAAGAEGGRVAVALRGWSYGLPDESWERQVAEGIDLFLDRRGGEAVFIPFQDAGEPFGDEPVAARVRDRMKPGRHRALAAGAPPEARVAALAGCDLVLGMRLHALVVGAHGGRPLVGLAYDPKVAAVMDALGAAEHRVDLAEVTASTLGERLDDAWQRRHEIGPRVAAAAAGLAVRARANAEMAIALLDAPPRPRGATRGLALLKRTTRRLMAAVAERDRSAEDERRGLLARAEEAEAAVGRWEASRAGRVMRAWRRWRA